MCRNNSRVLFLFFFLYTFFLKINTWHARSDIFCSRDGEFLSIWERSIQAAGEFEIEELNLPRQRKIPMRLQYNGTENHVFTFLKIKTENYIMKFSIKW